MKTIDVGVYGYLYQSNKRFFVLEGGAGSGKSTAAAYFAVYKALTEQRRILCARKVYRRCKESVYEDIKKALNFYEVDYRAKTSPLGIYVPCTGSEFLFTGCDNPEDLKSISEVDLAWMEEADQFTVNDFININSRVRLTGKNLHVMLTYNPLDCWIPETIFDNPELYKKTLHLLTNWTHNKHNLNPEYIETLQAYKNIDSYYYDVYTLGKRGSKRKGAIFMPLKVAQSYPPSEFSAYGIDVGFNDPSVVIRADYAQGEWFLREMLYEGMTQSQLLDWIKNNIPNKANIFVDPSSASLIQDLHFSGWNVMKGVNAIMEGIRTLQSTPINTNINNINLNREWKSYMAKQDKYGNFSSMPAPNQSDHAIDAARYAIHSSNYYQLIKINKPNHK